jgi:peptidoglycan/xylan/chitin deacetylase (PgdA/CDA1 family)
MRAILTFHSIDDSGSVLSYPAQLFAQLLQAVARAGLPVCDLDTLLLPEAKEGIALTFDDGLRSVFTAALPILRDHAAPAHLFLTTGAVGGDNRWPSQPARAPRFPMMSWTEVEQLHDAGCRIEGHTVSHPDLRALADEAVLAESAEADAAIARRLGRAPRYFAYPYGALNTRIASLLRERYRACLTTKLRPLRDDHDPAALGRIDSYYLRHRWLARDLRAPSIRGYIMMRRWLREVRAPW